MTLGRARLNWGLAMLVVVGFAHQAVSVDDRLSRSESRGILDGDGPGEVSGGRVEAARGLSAPRLYPTPRSVEGRSDIGMFDATEEEIPSLARAILAATSAGRSGAPIGMPANPDPEIVFEVMSEALTPDGFAEFRRAANPDFAPVLELADRLNLSRGKRTALMDAQRRFLGAVDAVVSDPETPAVWRAGKIRELETMADAEMTAILTDVPMPSPLVPL